MFRRKLGIVFGIMFVFSLVSFGLVSAFGRKPVRYPEGAEDEMVIVTSIYPVYLVTKNICEGVEGVRVVNLTENLTGCAHDYQLTTKDMLMLETADLLVVNGGEMELFITGIAEKLQGLTIIDSCEGISFLSGRTHTHTHEESVPDTSRKAGLEGKQDMPEGVPDTTGESGTEGEQDMPEGVLDTTRETGTEGKQDMPGGAPDTTGESGTGEKQDMPEGVSDTTGENGTEGNPKISDKDGTDGAEETDHGTAVNGHVWMDMERYECQIVTIAKALAAADHVHAEQYAANAGRYTEKIRDLRQEYEGKMERLRGLEVVLFHDAFYYLCDEFGIEVLHGVDMDAESALSAGELAELADEVRFHGVRHFFAEEATGKTAVQLAGETGGSVLFLDPISSGPDELDAYVTAMKKNLDLLLKMAE